MKKYISNLKTLIIIVILVILFQLIFGSKNILIGVGTITIFYMFKAYNLTVNLWNFFVKILFINISMGLCAFFGEYNVFLALVLNFLITFLIIRNFYNTFKMEMYFPFLLQYAFILFNPIGINTDQTFSLLAIRLLSLSICPIVVVLDQMIHFKNFFINTKKMLLETIINNFIDNLENNAHHDIDANINTLKNILYDYKKDEINFNKNLIFLNIVSAIENLNNIKHINNHDKEQLIIFFKKLLKMKNTNEFYDFNLDINSYYIKNNILIIINSLLNTQGSYNLNNIKDLSNDFFKRKRYLFEMTFALKTALAVSVLTFIISFFQFVEMRWALFTVISVLTPIKEKTKQKMKDRFISTILGSIVISILFYFITSPMLRTIVILLSSYINMFMVNYRQKMFFVTLSAIGAIMVHETHFSINDAIIRIIMVMLGIFIGYIFNNYFYPCTITKYNNFMYQKYCDIISLIKQDILNLKNYHVLDHKIFARVLLPTILKTKVEQQIAENNANIKPSITKKDLVIVNDLFYDYNTILYHLNKENYAQK